MVTEAPKKMSEMTPEEWAESAEEETRFRTALGEAIEAGIAEGARGRKLSKAEIAGVDSIVQGVFLDRVGLGHEFDGDAAFWAQEFAEKLVADALLTKLLGVWAMEGAVTDYVEVTDGIVGQAADHAAQLLKPYLKASGRFE